MTYVCITLACLAMGVLRAERTLSKAIADANLEAQRCFEPQWSNLENE